MNFLQIKINFKLNEEIKNRVISKKIADEVLNSCQIPEKCQYN